MGAIGVWLQQNWNDAIIFIIASVWIVRELWFGGAQKRAMKSTIKEKDGTIENLGIVIKNLEITQAPEYLKNLGAMREQLDLALSEKQQQVELAAEFKDTIVNLEDKVANYEKSLDEWKAEINRGPLGKSSQDETTSSTSTTTEDFEEPIEDLKGLLEKWTVLASSDHLTNVSLLFAEYDKAIKESRAKMSDAMKTAELQMDQIREVAKRIIPEK